MAESFYYKVEPNATETGPIDGKTLRDLAGSGTLSPESLLRKEDSEWVAASSVKGLVFGETQTEDIPQAKPVAAPLADNGNGNSLNIPAPQKKKSGLTLPDLAGAKKSVTIPAGLGDLKVGEKGGTSAPKSAPVVKKETSQIAKPAEVVPIAKPVEVKAEKKAAVTAKPVAKSIDVTEVKPATSVPNVNPDNNESPVAPAVKVAEPSPTKPDSPSIPTLGKAGPKPVENMESLGAATTKTESVSNRPAASRNKRGGIGSLFSFDAMIAPTVVKTVFYMATAVILLIWLLATGVAVLGAVVSGELLTMIGAGIGGVIGLVLALLKIIVIRVAAEMVIVFFKMHDEIGEMKDHFAKQETQ